MAGNFDGNFDPPGLLGFPAMMPGMADMAPNAMPAEMAIPPLWANTTTVMMRNIPNKYTQRMLLTEINETGFLGTFDFLYLPIDPETAANRGYAFLNFIDPGFAWMFKTSYEGRKMRQFKSTKVVSVMPATLQGFDANYAHYSSARVSRGDPAARPLFLREPTQLARSMRGGKGGRGEGGKGGRGGGKGGDRRRNNQMQDFDSQPRPPAMNMMVAPKAQGASPYFPEAGAGDFGGAASFLDDDDEPDPVGGGGGPPPGPPPSGGDADGQRPLVPKFCPQCGGATQPHFQFCPHCGFDLNSLFAGRSV